MWSRVDEQNRRQAYVLRQVQITILGQTKNLDSLIYGIRENHNGNKESHGFKQRVE